MKRLEPIRLKSSYYSGVEESIRKFFLDTIFAPLISELRESNIEIKNDTGGALLSALRSGRVYYESGLFRGGFNSEISKELKSIGASYVRSKKAWRLADSKLDSNLRVGVQIAEQRLLGLQSRVISKIDDIDIDGALKQLSFNFDDSVKKINKDLGKTIKSLSIPFELTPEQSEIIKEQWQENLKIFVKDWAEENILSMRNEILRNTESGFRAAAMERTISRKYQSSKTKARFLARQETSLLMSKVRETRYQDAGVFRYEWRTSQDSRVRSRHADLNGKIFSWGNPPIVNEEGDRKNPGEDFECRCIAIPILE